MNFNINQSDILTGRTTLTTANVGTAATVTLFYSSSIQKVASSSNYYISAYLSNTATGSSDQQLFDIGWGSYSATGPAVSAGSNYKWYAQECLVSQNSKFTFDGINLVDSIVFINYNDVLLKDRINPANYSLTFNNTEYTTLANTNVIGVNPLCGRS